MKRTNINNCKRVGNKIDNIIGQCEGSGIAVSYNCVESDIIPGEYVCIDPGDGSGNFESIQACTDSGCEFEPLTIHGMALWLHAKEDDIVVYPPPFISKWKDKRYLNPVEFVSLGLGDDTYPSWNGTTEWVTFDGEDYMQTSDTINLDTETDLGWCIAVTTYMEDWDDTEVIIGDKDSNNNLIKFNTATTVHLKLYNPTLATASTKGVTIDTPATLVNGTPYVFIINMDPTTNDAALWIDGEKQIDGFTFPDGYDFHELDEIGAKNSGQLGISGGIKEIIVYKGKLTDTQVGQLTFYMHSQL